MRSHRLLMFLLFGLGCLALAGCGDEGGLTGPADNAAQTDEEAIQALMAAEDGYFGPGESMEEDQVQIERAAGKRSPSGAPIESFYFVRRILERDITRDIHIEHPDGEPAVATVHTHMDLRGIFRLFYDDPDNVYLPGVIDKRLVAAAEHDAVFVHRPRLADRRHRGWRLSQVSGVEIVSRETTKQILSLEISSASVHQVITDPLALVPVRELPTFEPGEEVTLRVTTNDETDYVFLHTGHGKREFTPAGGGVFEATWAIPERRDGFRRLAVDVIDEGTLFDDEAPYDSVIWVLPFRVAREAADSFEDM